MTDEEFMFGDLFATVRVQDLPASREVVAVERQENGTWRVCGSAIANTDGIAELGIEGSKTSRVYAFAIDHWGEPFTPNRTVAYGDIIRPSVFLGWLYRVTDPGTLPDEEPAWWNSTPGMPRPVGSAMAQAEMYFQPIAHGPVDIEWEDKGEGDPHWDNVVGLYRPVDGVIRDISTLSNPMLYNTGLIIDALEHFSGLPVMRLKVNNRAAFRMPPLGEDDFTIEMFHRADATHRTWPRVWSTLDQYALSSAAVTMQISSASGSVPNALFVFVGTTLEALTTPAGTGATGVLTHAALCRRGEQIYLAYNGQIVNQLEIPVFNDTNPTFVFGQGNGSEVAQWFTEVRITKGVARYTENFTPPTEPFPNFK